tara:strand:+ start:2018 stop:2713 length:696 start_codon:yes stop_codon:yes gene_type:complete
MPRAKKQVAEEQVTINDLGWTEYVLELLSDDEKIKGNPTTDGLRRIFEIALNCTVINSESTVEQTPDLNNGNRGTVVHSLTYVLKDKDVPAEIKTRTVNGAADVYWGNCDKIFRNHPIAVAETRAEGRALRRGLRLRKVVAAEELASEIEDDIDGTTVGKISDNQINFVDVLCKRLDINALTLAEHMELNNANMRDLTHKEGVSIIRQLSGYQQDTDSVPEFIKGYTEEWR